MERAEDQPVEGMTLRDYFAGQALTMFSAIEFVRGLDAVAAKVGTNRYAVAAQMAYELADAMLAERSKL